MGSVGAKKAAVEWSLHLNHLGLHVAHDIIPAGAISDGDEKRIVSDEGLLPRLTTVVWYDFQMYQSAERHKPRKWCLVPV